ncbi:hypothetical protein GCM10010182_43100 [Actinomadura cremea]|nr:hypothetical protein GCM10010182_43100 [Actinomadura cremea]
MSDKATGRPMDHRPLFRIASVTKSFTSTVVPQLAAERRLSPDDTVEERPPGPVRGNGNDGSKITARQLLAQTSGLHDDTSDPETSTAFPGPYVHGYYFDFGDVSTLVSPPSARTSGGIVSTVDDVARFHRALFTGRLLPRPQMREPTNVRPVSDDGKRWRTTRRSAPISRRPPTPPSARNASHARSLLALLVTG